MALSLLIPLHSYLFGFAQGDGSLSRDTRNRGKLRIELATTDRELLLRLKDSFPGGSIRYRTRDTNYALGYQSAIWTMHQRAFREELHRLGLPIGVKSAIVQPPSDPYCVADYWRGLVDADGSVGFTGRDLPYLSFITTSEVMAYAYVAYVASVTGKALKRTSRNRRDRAFNILVMREDAVLMAQALYPANCFGLNRKVQSAAKVSAWVRPTTMRRNVLPHRPWTAEQDSVVMTMLPTQAARVLGRTVKSVGCRKIRLRKAGKHGLTPPTQPC